MKRFDRSNGLDTALYKNIHFTLPFLQECFPHKVYAAYIIKPEKFWEKQKTSLGSAKYKFEVGSKCQVIVSNNNNNKSLFQANH